MSQIKDTAKALGAMNNPFSSGSLPSDFLTSFRPNKMTLTEEGIDPSVGGYTYIFFVTPDLNMTNAKEYLDCSILPTSQPDTLLTITNGNTRLIPMLTNFSRNITVNDEVAEALNAYETFAGNSIKYGGSSHNWNEGSFQVTYNDAQFFPVLRLHKFWMNYIDAVKKGTLGSGRSDENRDNYVMDYASAVYIFTTLPDGQTLTWWGRYVGVFPVSIPWSSIIKGDGNQGAEEISIGYDASFFECMNKSVIESFQSLTNAVSGSASKADPSSDPNPYRSAEAPTLVAAATGDSIQGQTYKLIF